MDTKTQGRLFAATLVCLWTVAAVAQETPAPPPQEMPAAAPEPESDVPAAAAEEAAPATEAVPAEEPAPAQDAAAEDAAAEAAAPEAASSPADTQASGQPDPTATPGAKRIVMLPVEFTVYEKSISGLEAVPDWSESAQYALGDAASKMLRLDHRFDIVPMPSFEGETGGLLREHVELFKIIADSVTSLLSYGGKAWQEKRANFDYTLGDGLAFLADEAQADYALIVAGAQIKQTGGSVFMQLLMAAGGVGMPGGGTFVVIGVVNLRSGDVAWFNWKAGAEVFGMTGSDLRNADAAEATVAKMFAEYPNSKLITFKPF
jgi:hypothetical protein